MTFDLSLEELWEGWAPQQAMPICPFAKEFEKWTEELCATTEKSQTLAAVNVAKVLLTDKYFEWRTFVPSQAPDDQQHQWWSYLHLACF